MLGTKFIFFGGGFHLFRLPHPAISLLRAQDPIGGSVI